MSTTDTTILRDLAKQYLDICHKPVQQERRDLWRKKNSFAVRESRKQKPIRPLIYVRAFAWGELPESKCVCEDPFYRQYENFLRHALFWDTFDDDSIFEPWVTLRARCRSSGWGLSGKRNYPAASRGAFKVDYPIKELEDARKLRTPRHEIDEEKTAQDAMRLEEAIGEVLTVDVDRAPAYRTWSADISTDLGYLRGMEHFMVDMMDHPEWLHQLVGFMRDGVLRTHEQAEAAGDWGLSAHQNQAMPYAEELQSPSPNVNGVKRGELWGFFAAQEWEGTSPQQHDEFLLQYQLSIMKHFGLVAYGCCEDLTEKIGILRQVPNLRRIAVSPFADVAKCAEQIGTDYIISYRPSPADMVSYDFNPDRIRKVLRKDFEAMKGTHFDVTLKDVETVEGHPDRVRKWVQIVRAEIERL
jgi:hypothetical protein